MKKVTIILIKIVIFLLIIPNFKLYSQCEEIILHNMKYKSNIDKELIKYALTYDYNSFIKAENDEFKRNNYLLNIKEKVNIGIKKINYNTQYSGNFIIELEEYSFKDNSFPFKSDFKLSYYCEARISSSLNIYDKIFTIPINAKDFEGSLKMGQNEAQKFIESRKDVNGKINRKLNAIYYYSLVDKNYGEYVPIYIHKIEFYSDNQYTKLLKVISPKSTFVDPSKGIRMFDGYDTIYYNNPFAGMQISITNIKSRANFYRVVEYKNTQIVNLTDYYFTGEKFMKGSFVPFDESSSAQYIFLKDHYQHINGYQNGSFQWFWKNGKLFKYGTFKDGQMNGCFFEWTENGICKHSKGDKYVLNSYKGSSNDCPCFNQ